jgi:uncharacterized heparinase superfamily protein
MEPWRANPHYRGRVNGDAPERLADYGMDARLGDAERGREIMRGVWRIGAERLPGEHETPWDASAPSTHFAARLHAFGWLGDLAAVGPAAEPRIVAALQSWVTRFGDWDGIAWDAALTAERLFAWLCHASPAFERGDRVLRGDVLTSLARQARLVAAAHRDLEDRPLAAIKAGAALVLAARAGAPPAGRLMELGEEMLIEAAAAQFAPDGAHLSRSPEALADAVFDMLTAIDSLVRADIAPPYNVTETLPRLVNMLRFMRLGDGGLACFHGGSEGDAAAIERAIAAVDAPPALFQFATHAAFQRIAHHDLTLLLDVGGAAPPLFGERAHASALAFEMSCGADRVIVNVGASADLLPEARQAARGTNAHSTLIVGDALSAALETRGRNAQRFSGPSIDGVRRSEDEDGVTLQGRHDGYRAQFGLLHRRYLFVDHAGRNVRGIDELARPTRLRAPLARDQIPFQIRFHLHPSVRAEMIEHQMIALETPSGARWRMRTDAPQIQLAPSAYWGARIAPQDAKQIVLGGAADPGGHGLAPPNRVRWAFARSD